MTVPHAIETQYAGCRFRSRLEARWAVFFDHLNIGWEYEPEGFTSQNGAYLPDFRLNSGIYVEVKGDDSLVSLTDRDRMGGLIDYHGPLAGGLLLLGPIPRVDRATEVVHHLAHWQEGVEIRPVSFRLRFKGWSLADPSWWGWKARDGATETLPESASWTAKVIRVELPDECRWYPLDPRLSAAYEAARSARFEYGQTPHPPAPRPTLGPLNTRRPTLGALHRPSSAG